jgi:hypothetical protein
MRGAANALLRNSRVGVQNGTDSSLLPLHDQHGDASWWPLIGLSLTASAISCRASMSTLAQNEPEPKHRGCKLTCERRVGGTIQFERRHGE